VLQVLLVRLECLARQVVEVLEYLGRQEQLGILDLPVQLGQREMLAQLERPALVE